MENHNSTFPSLFENNYIFADNAGGTQIPMTVINQINSFIKESYVQPLGYTKVSKKVTEIILEVRKFIDYFFNNQQGFIIMGSSASQLAFNFSYQFEDILNNNDEIVIANFCHESSIGCFERIKNKNKNIKVNWWKVRPLSLEANIDDLLILINNKTRLVIFPHTSNILGNILDVKSIIQKIKIKNPNVYTYVDGVAYAPHRLIDVDDFDCDCYVVSFYKIFGPRVSALYIKKELSDLLSGINHHFIEKKDHTKFELGGLQYELVSGLLGLKEYILQYTQCNEINRVTLNTFFQHIHQTEQDLIEYFNQFLENQTTFSYLTDKTKFQVPIFSLTTQDYNLDNICLFLNELGIGCKTGTFYSNRLLESLNFSQVLRISLAHYNNIDQLKYIIKHLKQFQKFNEIPFNYLYLKHPVNEIITTSFKDLKKDIYYPNERYRHFSLLKINQLTKDIPIEIIGDLGFFQSSQYNQFLGNTLRQYSNISKNLVNDSNFKSLINYFATLINTYLKTYPEYIMIHQIRVVVNENSETPVPEGIHQDGFNIIAIVCVQVENISGGDSLIYDSNKILILSYPLKSGELILLNDRQYFHSVSNLLKKDPNKPAYRDILVLTTIN